MMARGVDDTYHNHIVDAAQGSQGYFNHVLGPNVAGSNAGYATRIVGANKLYEVPSNVCIQRPLPAEPGVAYTYMGGPRQQNVTHLGGNAQRPMGAAKERSYDYIMDGARGHQEQKEDKSKGRVETQKGNGSKKFPLVKSGLVIIGFLVASCIALASLFAVSSLKNGDDEVLKNQNETALAEKLEAAFRRVAELQNQTRAMSNLTVEKSHLTDELQDALKRIAELQNQTGAGCPGFEINGKCFGVIIFGSGGLDYHDAKRVCAHDGVTNIGNIYTLDHFNKLRDHVIQRRGESRHTFINVWTGMTIDLLSGKILLTTGAVATYQGKGNHRNSNEWRTDEARRTNVYVSFWTDGLDHSDNPGGYGNVWPTFIWNAVLCEKSW